MSEVGQKAKYSLGVDVFRFTPESGLMSDIAPCPKSAKPGHRRFNDHPSARSSDKGILNVERLCGFLIDEELDDKRTVWCDCGMRLLFIGALGPVGFIINIKTSFKGLR
jgi:hypothetical protein